MLDSDKIYYAVHLLNSCSQKLSSNIAVTSTDYAPLRGQLIGSVSLRWQDPQPVFSPPPRPSSLPSPPTEKPLNYRILGYAFLKSTWGRGYATEANRAFLSAHGKHLSSVNEPGYVEAHVDIGNGGSERVLQKLGFRNMGSKPYGAFSAELEKVIGKARLRWREEEGEDGDLKRVPMLWMGGAWRDEGFVCYGMWVA